MFVSGQIPVKVELVESVVVFGRLTVSAERGVT